MMKKRIFSNAENSPNILSSGLCLGNHHSEHATGPQAETVKLRVKAGFVCTLDPCLLVFLIFSNSGGNVSIACGFCFALGNCLSV